MNKSASKLKKASLTTMVSKFDPENPSDTLPKQINSDAPYEKSDKGKAEKTKKKVKPLDFSKLQISDAPKKIIKTKVVTKKPVKTKKENLPNRFDSKPSTSPFSPFSKNPKLTESVLKPQVKKVLRPTSSVSTLKKTPITPMKKAQILKGVQSEAKISLKSKRDAYSANIRLQHT